MKLTAFREAILASHRVREFEKPGGSFNLHDKLKLPEKAARYLFYENKPDENGYRAFQLHELFHIFGQVPMFPAQQIPFYEMTLCWILA